MLCCALLVCVLKSSASLAGPCCENCVPEDTVGTTERCPGCSQFKHDFCVCTRCAEKNGPDPAEAPQGPEKRDLIVLEAMEPSLRGAAYVQSTQDGLYAQNLGFVKMLQNGIGLAMRIRDPEPSGRVRPDPNPLFLIAYDGRAHAARQRALRATVTSDVAGAFKLTGSEWDSGESTLLAELDNPRAAVLKALASPGPVHDLTGPVQRAARPTYCAAQNADGECVCLGQPASVLKKKCAVAMCTKIYHNACVYVSSNVVEIEGSYYCSPSHLPPAPKPRAVPVPLATRTHQSAKINEQRVRGERSMPDEGRMQYLEKVTAAADKASTAALASTKALEAARQVRSESGSVAPGEAAMVCVIFGLHGTVTKHTVTLGCAGGHR